ncbi:MAG: dihydroxy-acid dehydratase [Chloroflexi bacterium RBG_13_51_36]|nr:MAG: dihydroxy-acid dehydratase [Chloroflexi bacterium RBG_13_51_36]
MRSDIIKRGVERAPHRALLRAVGCASDDWDKPFIGVINSFSEIVPGHVHLQTIAKAVKEGVRSRGGVPFEVNTIAVCDGIAMNHPGMRYSLPSRELIADSVEIIAEAHAFDGLVFIPNCDKVTPGMLMAAVRLNLPSVFVSGGPMLAGKFVQKNAARSVDLITVFQAVGKVAKGKMTEAELVELEIVACPGCGSCAGMFTANTMNCLCEALGVALPGNGTIPAVEARRVQLAYRAGQQVMEALAKDIRPRDVVTRDSIYNAFAVDMALGGSTNSVLHLTAVAHEAGLDFPLSLINEVSDSIPNICRLSPASDYHIEDLDLAGGIPAVMHELSSLLKLEANTILDKPIGNIARKAKVRNREIIRPLSQPYAPTGGISILFGNLAPDGAVVKTGAMASEMLVHRGRARVFDSEEEATAAIMKGKFKSGDVIVIRYEGPRGGPGMPEMLGATSLLSGMGMDKEVALITDGRFSGGTRGAAIGHISPEAAEKGPIAALRNGDMINIDVPSHKLEVELSRMELKQRLASLPAFEPRIETGYLRRYSDEVSSASTGAVFTE